MTDRPPMPDPTEPRDDGGDPVGRLLRAAGPRPQLAAVRSREIRHAVRPAWEAEVRRHRRRPRWLATVAASVTLALLAAGLWGPGLWRPGRFGGSAGSRDSGTGPVAAVVERLAGELRSVPLGAPRSTLAAGDPVAPGTALETAPGARAAVRLADGRSLRLDSASRVVVRPGGEVDLQRGAIYLDSGPAASGAGVLVITPFGRVEEIGTQFEVRLDPGGLTVRVREGEVAVMAGGRRHRGLAGEELALAGGVVRRRAIEPWDAAFEWAVELASAPRLDDLTVEELLAFVSRETGLRTQFADPALAVELGSVTLHGDLEGLAPLAALDAVLPAVGLRGEVRAGRLVISSDVAGPGTGR